MVNPRFIAALRHYTTVNPWHTLFSICGVAISICIIIVIDTTSKNAKESLHTTQLFFSNQPAFIISSNHGGLDETVYRKLLQAGFDDAIPLVEGNVSVDAVTYKITGSDLVYAFTQRGTALTITGRENLWRADQLRGIWINRSAFVDAMPPAIVVSDISGEKMELDIVGYFQPGFANGADLLADISIVQHLLGRTSELDRIFLQGDKSESDIVKIKTLIGNNVLTKSSDDLDFTAHILSSYRINLNALGLIAALVACLLLYNTLSISVLQRQRELALYASFGVGRRTLAVMVFLEVLVIVAIGAILGVLVGLAVAKTILFLLEQFDPGVYALHADLALRVPAHTWIKVLGIGTFATLVACIVPSTFSPRIAEGSRAIVAYNRYSRTKTSALFFAGIGIMFVGYATTIRSPNLFIAYAGLFIQLAGVLLSVPLLVSWVISLLVKANKSIRNPGAGIAINNLDSSHGVCSMVVVCLVLVLSVGQSLDYVVTSLSQSVHTWVDQYFEADVYITRGIHTGDYFSDSERTRIEQHPEVVSTSAGIRVTQHSAHGDMDILALDLPDGMKGFSFISQVPSFLEYQSSRTCLITEALSIRANLAIGDGVELNTPSGNHLYRVIGIFRDYRPGNALLSVSLKQYRNDWNDTRLLSIGLNLKQALAEGEIDAIIKAAGLSGVSKTITAEIKSVVTDNLARSLYVMEAVKIGIVLTGLLGVVGSISILILQKKFEYLLYWRLGFSKKEIVSIIAVSALFLGLFAGLLSIPFALLIAHNIIDVINVHAFGWVTERVISVWTPVAALLLSVLATIAGSAIAVARTLKTISSQQYANAFHEQML